MRRKDYWGTAKRHRLPIALLVCLSMLASVLMGQLEKPKYTATTELLLSVSGGQSATDLNQASTYLERQMTSYARLVSTPVVLEPALKELGLDMTPAQLSSMVDTQVPTTTTLMDITVSADNPEDAARLANAVGDSTAKVVGEISPDPKGDEDSIKATVISRAIVPNATAKGLGTLPRLVIGLLAGLALSLGLVALLRALDRRVHRVDDLRRIAQRVPTLAGLRTENDHIQRDALLDGTSEITSDHRRIRSSLLSAWPAMADGSSPFTVAVTAVQESPAGALAAGIARALAETGRSALYVEADPSVGKQDPAGKRDKRPTIQRGRVPNLATLELGSDAPSLVEARDFDRQLAEAARDFDVVVLNAPSASQDAGAEEVARVSDGAVVVVELGRDKTAVIRDCINRVAAASPGAVVTLANGVDSLDG